MSLKYDFKEFNSKLKQLSDNFTGPFAKEGMFNALNTLKIDADTISPTTPKAIGTLRSDVKREIKQTSNETKGSLIWNQPYSEKMHEGDPDWNWSLPGSGPQFAADKLKMFGEKYKNVIGMTIKSKGI